MKKKYKKMAMLSKKKTVLPDKKKAKREAQYQKIKADYVKRNAKKKTRRGAIWTVKDWWAKRSKRKMSNKKTVRTRSIENSLRKAGITEKKIKKLRGK